MAAEQRAKKIWADTQDASSKRAKEIWGDLKAYHMNAGPALDLFQTIQAQIGQSFWRLSDEKIERDDDKEDFGHVQFGDDKVSLSLSAASGESDMTFRRFKENTELRALTTANVIGMSINEAETLARALETACEALKALQGRSGGAFTPDLALGNAMTTAAGNSKRGKAALAVIASAVQDQQVMLHLRSTMAGLRSYVAMVKARGVTDLDAHQTPSLATATVDGANIADPSGGKGDGESILYLIKEDYDSYSWRVASMTGKLLLLQDRMAERARS